MIKGAFFGFLTTSGIALFICGCASNKPVTAQQANYPREQIDAHGIFLENCATCHGQDGRAKTFHGRMAGAQNLTDAKFQSDTSDEAIRDAIKTGPKAMPAFENKLSASEIEALVAYVRTLKATQ